MLPINVDDARMKMLADVFGCMMGNFPFTYLGLPLRTTRSGIHDLTPLVTRVERKLTAGSTFLAYG
jgi:hypothetical protein